MSLQRILAHACRPSLSRILLAAPNLSISLPGEFLSFERHTSLYRSSVGSCLNHPCHFTVLLSLAHASGISLISLHILNILILYPATDKSNIWVLAGLIPKRVCFCRLSLVVPCFLSEFVFDLIYVERVLTKVSSSIKNSCSQMIGSTEIVSSKNKISTCSFL